MNQQYPRVWPGNTIIKHTGDASVWQALLPGTSANLYHGYGQAEEPGAVDLLTAYAPIVQGIVGGFTDPVRKAARLRVKYNQAIARGASPAQVQDLAAKLYAADQAVAAQQRMEQEKTEVLGLTKLMQGSVIALALAGTFFILMRALPKRRRR